MSIRWLTILGAALLFWAQPARAADPINLRVLYAGNPGSDREKDFSAFLGKHFAKVGTADYQKFSKNQAEGYDVVILDWTSIYPRDKDGKMKREFHGLNSPTPPGLLETYDRPTVMIGAAGGLLAGRLRLKIDWL